MRYIATIIQPNGRETRQTYDAASEKELRRSLKEKGLNVKRIRIDAALESADTNAVIKISSQIIFIVAAVMFAAVALSLPFPFVRKIWFREVWGFYGPINAALFVIIAAMIQHRSITVNFCGLAIVFYEQYLIWQGFAYFSSHQGLTPQIISFVAGAEILIVIMLYVFLRTLHALYLHYGVKYRLGKEVSSQEISLIDNHAIRCGIFSLYLIVPIITHSAPLEYQSREYLTMLRLLAEGIFLIGASGIGYEMQGIFKIRRAGLISLCAMLFHVAAMFVLIRWLDAKLPPWEEIFQKLS